MLSNSPHFLDRIMKFCRETVCFSFCIMVIYFILSSLKAGSIE